MDSAVNDLIEILHNVQTLLALPANDFCWSSWESSKVAIREIDGYIQQIKAGDYSSALDIHVLFAPTGPIQEVSISSGWGYEFLSLAKRFDEAAKVLNNR